MLLGYRQMNYYTYAYLREDGTPYYIGKGSGNRAFHKHKRQRVGVPPTDRILMLKEGLTEAQAFAHEVYMIAVFGRKDLGTGCLRNRTDGGEGVSGNHTPKTEEHKRKISEAHKGKVGSLAGRKHINNGDITRAIPNEDPIPSGWELGKHYRPSRTNNGRFWITNGEENIMLWSGSEIPNGYKRGRVCYTKSEKRLK